jgi:hypothetical protein
MSTRAVAYAILAGDLPYDVQVAAEGARKWLRAVEVPVIAQIVESEPTSKLAAPPVDSSDEAEARTPRQLDQVAEGPTPIEALPPTRPAFGGAPPPTRPYRRISETVRSPEMPGNRSLHRRGGS